MKQSKVFRKQIGSRVNPYAKKDRFMRRAQDKYFNAKVSKVAKDESFMYAYSSIVLALHELYGFGGIRAGRAVTSANMIWNDYEADGNEAAIMQAAMDLGVDVYNAVGFKNIQKSKTETKKTVDNFSVATQNSLYAYASAMVGLHEQFGFGYKRLNKVMTRAWIWWLRSCEIATTGKSIMDMCEEITGIRVDIKKEKSTDEKV